MDYPRTFHPCFVAISLLVHLLHFSTIEAGNGGGFSVRLIRKESFHKNSPSSPFYNPNEFHSHRFDPFYQVPKKLSAANDPSFGVTSNNGDYLMKLTVGTPPVDIYALADTGSDLVWVQCTPCEDCYNQKYPLFDPQNSTTYSTIQFGSDLCNIVPGASSSSENLCSYSYGYADGSVTSGVLSKETLTLNSATGEAIAVGNIAFGCGHRDKGTFNENDMGIIGLGGGPLSLVSQMGTLYGGRRFSQCLVPFHTDPSISGTISFGENSGVSGEGVVTTPLVYAEGQTSYSVTLKGITVGDKFVPFNSSGTVSLGNIMIDSGTPTTYVPPELYDSLVEELKAQMSLTPLQDDPDLGSQLCYGSEANLVTLTANFDGADVPLAPTQTFISPKDGAFCFAMAGADDGLYIFGNYAQSNLLIGFDLDKKTVSFKPTDCTNQ